MTDIHFKSTHLPVRSPGLPDPGEVHLWYLNVSELGGSLQLALGAQSLPDQLTPRQQRLGGRFYLKLLLGAYLGCPGHQVKIVRGDKGKPRLDAEIHDQELHFSLAHSAGRLMIGVTSGGVIGVDLEPLQRRIHKPMGVARRYFSSMEYEQLQAISEEHRLLSFIYGWAKKEAVVKATGHGIANRLCHFTVNMDLGQPPSVVAMADDQPELWTLLRLKPETGFVAAIATRQPQVTARGFHLQAAD